MTHELKKIVQAGTKARESGIKAVLASVVALEGSSYRRPGVRMLILEDQTMVGAVSGGCVEKEIARQAASVFEDGLPKVMTYDGRYRLGCEGILYILIEPFDPPENTLTAFRRAVSDRLTFRMVSHFTAEHKESSDFGSYLFIEEDRFVLRPGFSASPATETFEVSMDPCFKLMILGAEHDAVQLCTYASLTGWEVCVVATPSEEKQLAGFPGAEALINTLPEELNTASIDAQTAVMLMTHSFVKDLKYLLALKDSRPAYLGLLGPASRREKLLNEFLEHCPDVAPEFFDTICGPAGLNVGAETPQEIAIAVLAEILSVIRAQEPIPLKDKKGAIHS